jgi:aryl-alcohol dehydrogenase-like predicted oxidoreductase
VHGFWTPSAGQAYATDIGPETCFGSKANEDRRSRADELAKKYGVSTHNIATAWVLA